MLVRHFKGEEKSYRKVRRGFLSYKMTVFGEILTTNVWTFREQETKVSLSFLVNVPTSKRSMFTLLSVNLNLLEISHI